MKRAKFSTAEETRLVVLDGSAPGFALITWVLSSGSPLVAQPSPGTFSFWKTSLVTPISTLEASPENRNMDLFWAFQPKRVTVPSLPLRFRRPATWKLVLSLAKFARL